MVLTCGQMREAEEAAFARGVSAAELMDEAGRGMAGVIAQFFSHPGHAVLYLGKGNNAGDALVAARHLADAGWTIHARLAFSAEDFKELPARHWQTLHDRVSLSAGPDELRRLAGRVILLDGLVGIGVTGALHGPLAAMVREMNELRLARHATTIALDLPSGLDSDNGTPGDPCVQADMTITVGHVKNILLADAATNYVGRLAVVPLHELDDARGEAGMRVLTTDMLLPLLPPRPFDFHKGLAGRAGIIAGSRGFLGAAVLAANGALHGGAGLVTLFVKEAAYPLLAVMTPPEVMVKCVGDYREVLEEDLDALAIGPGLAFAHEEEVLTVMLSARAPAVIDADALNIIARHGLGRLSGTAGPRLLTPHPGEMARLAAGKPEFAKLDRRALARAFVAEFPGTVLLLKGARTVIAAANRPLSFNTTGNPGMASGGMGDTLTGLCTALAAQGVPLPDAASLGAWLSGRAAELAMLGDACSQESLGAGDVCRCLGAAFASLGRLDA